MGYRDDMDMKPSHLEMVTVQAMAGTVAGACSSIITTPVDTIKTRLQVCSVSHYHCITMSIGRRTICFSEHDMLIDMLYLEYL